MKLPGQLPGKVLHADGSAFVFGCQSVVPLVLSLCSFHCIRSPAALCFCIFCSHRVCFQILSAHQLPRPSSDGRRTRSAALSKLTTRNRQFQSPFVTVSVHGTRRKLFFVTTRSCCFCCSCPTISGAVAITCLGDRADLHPVSNFTPRSFVRGVWAVGTASMLVCVFFCYCFAEDTRSFRTPAVPNNCFNPR